MADALLGATVQVLLEKALSLVAVDRIGLLLAFKKDLERLSASAEIIQAFLADAEVKQTGSQAVQIWLNRLQRVAFDADIVLDELNYEFLRRKVKSRNQLQGKVCTFLFFSKDDLSFRWRMASKIRDINVKLKDINQQATEFGLVKMVKMAAPLRPTTTGAASSRQTDSLPAPSVVGRSNDESEIVEILLSPSEKVVSVLPIVGLGGLGKTTLAKSIYNNQQIQDHFNKRIWVCVSEKFDVLELFKLILGSLTRKRVELPSRDDVVQEIRKVLEGKRYLLVLDDVWNEMPGSWDTFFDSLVGINKTHGSKCLVTTRLQTVASIVSRHHPPYVLRKLSNDECWYILKEKAVQTGEIPEELTLIRKQLIKRCDGLPLAANVIGGLLHFQRREEWQSIVENRVLNFSDDPKDSIMQILKLSFDYLSSPLLKRCFAYCSLFSKDAEIDRDLLIELWMAEGFLEADIQNGVLMEETGSKYLNVLVQNSLLEKGDQRMGNYYKMHDLVHDLAQSISKLQSFNSENDAINYSPHQVRYLALDAPAEIMTLNYASALILKRSSISNEMLWKFKRLHILNLSKVETVELPSSVGKLKHLRFLAISKSKIKSLRLPESICKLYNLQTLRMIYCNFLDVLPQGMNSLISLRHLHYYSGTANSKMPLKMGRLTSLQTLEFFNVGEELGRQIEELGFLKYLKGKLEIRNLELVKGKEGAERADLSGKQNLRELTFCWSSEDREAVQISDENVLEGLKPHQNLEALRVTNFMGDRFPQWFANLSKLVKLTLRGCNKCIELPMLGHLPSLENLVLQMENVSCIGVSFYGLDDCRGGVFGSTSSFGDRQVAMLSKKSFPALKCLLLESMKSLIEWKEAALVDNDDVGVFPVLEDLTIESCSQLTSTPTHFPSLKRLTIRENVQVSVVKNILSKVNGTLEQLALGGLDDVTHLCDVVRGYTSLQVLRLRNCRNLMELPEDVYQLQSLGELEISQCPKILHVGPTRTANSHLTSLETFRVIGCEGLISIATETLEGCISLSSLVVWNCPSINSFPLDLQQTPSLSVITLYNCPKLFTDKKGMLRGFGHLTCLSSLHFGPFSTDDCSMELFDWSGLMSCASTLRDLTLYGHGLRAVESLLPDEFQHFTTLQSLSIFGFEKIKDLPDWFGNLASLERLDLRDCEKLRYLPSMPALRRLTKLRILQIGNCPLLEERCTSNSGPDSEWSKISQLPNLRINFY